MHLIIIRPGAGYSEINNKLAFDEYARISGHTLETIGESGGQYDHYPCVDINKMQWGGNCEEKDNLESFAELMVAPICKERIQENKKMVLIFGSRGGQIVLPKLWQLGVNLPAIVINAGCCRPEVQPPPNGGRLALISCAQDYFNTQDSKVVIKWIEQKRSPDSAQVFVLPQLHMPKLEARDIHEWVEYCSNDREGKEKKRHSYFTLHELYQIYNLYTSEVVHKSYEELSRLIVRLARAYQDNSHKRKYHKSENIDDVLSDIWLHVAKHINKRQELSNQPSYQTVIELDIESVQELISQQLVQLQSTAMKKERQQLEEIHDVISALQRFEQILLRRTSNKSNSYQNQLIFSNNSSVSFETALQKIDHFREHGRWKMTLQKFPAAKNLVKELGFAIER